MAKRGRPKHDLWPYLQEMHGLMIAGGTNMNAAATRVVLRNYRQMPGSGRQASKVDLLRKAYLRHAEAMCSWDRLATRFAAETLRPPEEFAAAAKRISLTRWPIDARFAEAVRKAAEQQGRELEEMAAALIKGMNKIQKRDE